MSNLVLPELVVMQNVAEAIADLGAAEKKRVASWLVEYVAEDEVADVAAPVDAVEAEAVVEDAEVAPVAEEAEPAKPVFESYTSFADLYDDVAPKSGTQKAVTAGYWLEMKEGQQSWKASEVNKLLKQIDVKVSSISIVLTNAVKSKDPMITQLARLSDSERSRKTFCLKESGIQFVENRIA